jgi:hypothetical protein
VKVQGGSLKFSQKKKIHINLPPKHASPERKPKKKKKMKTKRLIYSYMKHNNSQIQYSKPKTKLKPILLACLFGAMAFLAFIISNIEPPSTCFGPSACVHHRRCVLGSISLSISLEEFPLYLSLSKRLHQDLSCQQIFR